MKELLKKFEEKAPAIVFEWNDKETEAKGWVVINSLRGGAAGGGTRMRLGLDRQEVESLAKTMEIKFTVSGPAIGGAKSGINFDPVDRRKVGVLERWYQAVKPLLKFYYGTGGDLNIDEINEVIPITQDLGLWHPQEGIVTGYYKAHGQMKVHKLEQLRMGVSKVLENHEFSPNVRKKYTVADMITGFGVAESIKHYYQLWGGTIQEKRAIIQGWGNVGAATGYYLSKMGVKIVGIIAKHGGVINPNGFSFQEISEMLSTQLKNPLQHEKIEDFHSINKRIWDLDCEIFIPAAASRLVTKSQISRLIKRPLEVVSCGANVPFDDPEIFYGDTMAFADEQVAVIPDFIANCGMARVFAYLMTDEVEVTDHAIFSDTSSTIYKALQNVQEQNPARRKLSLTSYELALQQLI